MRTQAPDSFDHQRVGGAVLQRVTRRLKGLPRHIPLQQVYATPGSVRHQRQLLQQQAFADTGQASEEDAVGAVDNFAEGRIQRRVGRQGKL